MITFQPPQVAIEPGFSASRDFRAVASILRGHLKEKRARMTIIDLANMVGDVSQKGTLVADSVVPDAVDLLIDLGLVRLVGRYYEATDVVVRGIYSEAVPRSTNSHANRSQSPVMAINNRRLGRKAA